jgi:hypothetical protein
MVIMEFEKARQILNKDKENKYTDEEVIEILKLLNVFTEVIIHNLLNKKADEKCNSVR